MRSRLSHGWVGLQPNAECKPAPTANSNASRFPALDSGRMGQRMKGTFPVRLTEELVLLMLDESSGYIEMVPGWDFSCVMAGAVIADLALENRIDTDLEALHLIDPTPTARQAA